MADNILSSQGQDNSAAMSNQAQNSDSVLSTPRTDSSVEPSMQNSAPPPSFVGSTPNVSVPPQPDRDQPVSSQPFTPPPVFTQSSESTTNEEPMIASFKPKHKSPILAVVALMLLVLIGGGAAFFLLRNNGNPSTADGRTNQGGSGGVLPKQQINLTYWGLWEPNAVMRGIISEYQTQNPNTTITYVEQTKTDYRARLQTAINNGTGPDIFRFHNTWLPMLQSSMQPDSKKRVNMDDFLAKTKEDGVKGGETFGVPLGFDSLVLFYNTQKFQSAGLSQPPSTWNDLMNDSEKLVVRDPKSGIQVGGVAMGTTNNVDHWSDIIGLLLMQNESDPSIEIPSEVLAFYTQFSGVKNVWNSTLPSSTYAFATEKVAMMFGPSWRAHEIRSINPNLEFKTAPAPQLSGENPVAWASYWLEGVSRQSKNADEAWKFLAFLSESENLQKLYTTAAQASPERRFGEPYPRTSLITSLETDPIVGSVVTQGKYAKSWYLCSRTFDDGLNDGIIKYFEDAVNAINKGTDVVQVIPTLQSGVQQKLGMYGLIDQSPYQQVIEPKESSKVLFD